MPKRDELAELREWCESRANEWLRLKRKEHDEMWRQVLLSRAEECYTFQIEIDRIRRSRKRGKK